MGSDRCCVNSQRIPKIGFFILVILYLLVARVTRYCALSTDEIIIGHQNLSLVSFAGAFDSVGNAIIIALVVFYGKAGFLAGVFFYALTLINLFKGIIFDSNLQIIPGLFTGLCTLLAVVLIYRRNNVIGRLQNNEIKHLKEQQLFSENLFEQTATALVSAIDAKDEYSRGHSLRVAEYSVKIAEAMGKDEAELREVYYAALLHDVGKIGISDSIINKKGMPTDEEYKVIMQHPIIGNQILSSISEYPYLSIGAHYHHERFDGKGYPDGLKGEDIPEIARIIAVADTFDAMTSSRSYRDALPQQLAWEEIVKGTGSQFDPRIVKMAHGILDIDKEFKTMEKNTVKALSDKNGIHFKEFRSTIAPGILILSYPVRMHLKYHRDELTPVNESGPALILFDSFDGRAHSDENQIRELGYYEYCEIHADGTILGDGIRNVRTNMIEYESSEDSIQVDGQADDREFDIEAVKINDHFMVRIDDGHKKFEVLIALPDATRFVYMGLAGEHCSISEVNISKSKEQLADDYLPRIAEELNYIDGPQGDIPSIQLLGHRSDHSQGIPITDGLKVSFHTKSMDISRLIWHCAYVALFTSKDGQVFGEDYEEYALIRLDGECWEGSECSDNKLVVNMNDNFEGWDRWKQGNREGTDCTVTFRKNDNVVVVTTEILGLFIKCTTTIKGNPGMVYAALTGDQCVITNIKIEL